MIQYHKPNIHLKDEDYLKIRDILESGWVSIGRNVEMLEERIKRIHRVKYAVACSSATQALIIAVKAAGWRNKKIAVPAFTWPSTIYAIESNNGNKPVFCDVNQDDWLINIDSAMEKFDGILAVDTFGNECGGFDMPTIYDAAHGFGLPNVGNRGAIAEVISFSFTKVVTACEGGVILTHNDDVYNIALELRRLSARMEEINALIAIRSIENYKSNRAERSRIIEKYAKGLKMPYKTQGIVVNTNNSIFSILLKDKRHRDSIASSFDKSGIGYKVYYDPLVGGLKNTDYIYERILSLPLYPGLENQDLIIDTANAAAENCEAIGMKYLKSSYLSDYLQREVI